MDNFDKRISRGVKSFLNENVEFKNEERHKILETIEHSKRKKKRFHPVYWSVLASAAIIICILTLSFINDGNSNIQDSQLAGSDSGKSNLSLEELEKIKISIKNEQVINGGDHQYLIEIENKSKYPLLEGTLFLSHEIKVTNGIKGNPFKMVVEINKKIPSGKSFTVESEVPSSVFDQSKVDVNGLTIELKGYLKEISPQSSINILQSNSVVEGAENTEQYWNESALFESGSYTMIGEEGRLGFIYDDEEVVRFYPDKVQKYMWHFWGDENEFEGNLKVIGTHENDAAPLTVFEGGLGGANNGADRHAPSNMSLPASGMWKLDAYIGESLFGTVYVKVHEE